MSGPEDNPRDDEPIDRQEYEKWERESMKPKTTPRDYTFKYANKNPFEKLHPDEPWFFIRAQDALSPESIQHYAALLKRESDKAYTAEQDEKGAELLKQSLGVMRVAHSFIDWQADHPELTKLPD